MWWGCPAWCRGSWYCPTRRFALQQQRTRCPRATIEIYAEFQKWRPPTCLDLMTRNCGLTNHKWLTYRQLSLPLTSRYCFFNCDVHWWNADRNDLWHHLEVLKTEKASVPMKSLVVHRLCSSFRRIAHHQSWRSSTWGTGMIWHISVLNWRYQMTGRVFWEAPSDSRCRMLLTNLVQWVQLHVLVQPPRKCHLLYWVTPFPWNGTNDLSTEGDTVRVTYAVEV